MADPFIRIRGAREHNLKGIDVDIPRDKLTVITGLSGSGKSTLAFDTVYAEGQRKYMESLSAYARQFLDQLRKPELDSIDGLPPTIAIEQRGSSSNPRSTVATTTEIYDYLRVLFARAGTPHCWECGRVISSTPVSQIVDAVMAYGEGTKLMVIAPIVRGQKGEHKDVFAVLHKQGFVRVRVDGEIQELNPNDLPKLKKTFKHDIDVVIDRIVIKTEVRSRLADSIETALRLGSGLVVVARGEADGFVDHMFSEKLACPVHPHVMLPEMEPRMFSFNSPHGACPKCTGLGTTLEFDPELIIADDSLTLETGAIDAWRRMGKRMNIYYARVLRTFARDFGVDYSKPVAQMPEEIRQILLFGTGDDAPPVEKPKKQALQGLRFDVPKTSFEGVIPNLKRRFETTDSDSVKSRMVQYMSEQPCEVCHGKRLRPEALCVRLSSSRGTGVSHVQKEAGDEHVRDALATKKKKKKSDPVELPGFNIDDISNLNVGDACQFFTELDLGTEGKQIAEPILREVNGRLSFLNDVGLNYLNLSRKTGSLSGGEAQRIRLATQVGSKLVGVCYVLDEPTIGLHQRDNDRLITTVQKLRDIGNTVIMVEHDEDCIRAADYLIDIGPAAGEHGGRVIAFGPMPDVLEQRQSNTIKYITGELEIALPVARRPMEPAKRSVILKGCTANNLKDVSVTFPLGGLICVTGVSGSGKSTLVNQTLLPALKRRIYGSRTKPGEFRSLTGIDRIDKVIEIDQSPIGRTPRSNPATYTGVFDEIRKVLTATKAAKIRGYGPGRFSFNVKGGRCEACQGAGTKVIEMHFLPDVYVECEVCKGSRYNAETLEITYRGKTVADILAMTVADATTFFENFPAIHRVLKALRDVGLGYIQLGQPSTQLSGGEAQRVKLATELGKNATGHTFYILDEPTTGLHFADIANLLNVLNRLADKGNTIVVIEHNLDVIKCADWIIDMGPEGGDGGGTVVAEGRPEKIVATPASHTGRYLKSKLTPHEAPAGKVKPKLTQQAETSVA